MRAVGALKRRNSLDGPLRRRYQRGFASVKLHERRCQPQAEMSCRNSFSIREERILCFQSPKHPRVVRNLPVGVEPAGVGKNPQSGVSDFLPLKPDANAGKIKGVAVKPEPQKSGMMRFIAQNLSREDMSPAPQLFAAKFVSPRCRPRDDIGDAEIGFEQSFRFIWR